MTLIKYYNTFFSNSVSRDVIINIIIDCKALSFNNAVRLPSIAGNTAELYTAQSIVHHMIVCMTTFYWAILPTAYDLSHCERRKYIYVCTCIP